MPHLDLGVADIEDPVEIGRGGFGVVYRARQAKLDRTVAVKVIEQAVDIDSRRRFEQEGRALGSLSGHPNIVVIHDTGFTPAGFPFLVLEYLPDGSLADVVGRRGALGPDEATDLIIQIAGALETVHRAGVLHRDVKPENILLGAYGEPKLGDFGIARLQDSSTMTGTGTIWGSPAHAAPEVIEGRGASVRSDVYSLGSALYVLLSGQVAFQRDTDESIIPVLHRVTTQPPPDLRANGVPEPIWQVVAQTLAKDPAHRPDSAAALGDLLNLARGQLGLAPVAMRVRGVAGGPAPGSATAVTPARPVTAVPAGHDVATSHPAPVPAPVANPVAPPVGAAAPQHAYTAAPIYSDTVAPHAGVSGGGGSWGGAPSYMAAPTPKRSNLNVWVVVACAAVLVAALVTGSIVIATRPSGSAGPTTSTASTATTTAGAGAGEPTSTPTSAAAVDLSDALIRPASIPGDWIKASDSYFTGIESLKPCGEAVDPSVFYYPEHQTLTGSHSGATQIIQGVAAMANPDVADQFISSMSERNSCGTYLDDEGVKNTVKEVDLGQTWGDQSVAFKQSGSPGGQNIDVVWVMLRQHQNVSVVATAGAAPADEEFIKQLADSAESLLGSAGG